MHDLGRVLDALSQPSPTPKLGLGKGGAGGPQIGLAGAEVGLAAPRGRRNGSARCLTSSSARRSTATASSADCRLFGLWRVPAIWAARWPSLRDGGRVGAVVDEDLFEHVARLPTLVGDNEDPVLGAASGGGDVEAAMGGGGRGNADADVHGVALVALGGGGVAEPDMRSGIAGGERHLPVSVEV